MIKLYDIVIVQQDGFEHYGEVLSRVTPTSTVMVRTVPGHPGTLQEMHIGKLKACARVKYVHYAQVIGRGSFPIDMLRRECAAPLNFDLDTLKTNPSFGFAEHLIIAKASDYRSIYWNTDRWLSFGWELRHVGTEKLAKL